MEKQNAVYTITENQSPEEARREHVMLVVAHAGSEAVVYGGDAVGEVLNVDGFDAGGFEVVAHAQAEGVADAVKIFDFHDCGGFMLFM